MVGREFTVQLLTLWFVGSFWIVERTDQVLGLEVSGSALLELVVLLDIVARFAWASGNHEMPSAVDGLLNSHLSCL